MAPRIAAAAAAAATDRLLFIHLASIDNATSSLNLSVMEPLHIFLDRWWSYPLRSVKKPISDHLRHATFNYTGKRQRSHSLLPCGGLY